jgi:hypothetical protein
MGQDSEPKGGGVYAGEGSEIIMNGGSASGNYGDGVYTKGAKKVVLNDVQLNGNHGSGFVAVPADAPPAPQSKRATFWRAEVVKIVLRVIGGLVVAGLVYWLGWK